MKYVTDDSHFSLFVTQASSMNSRTFKKWFNIVLCFTSIVHKIAVGFPISTYSNGNFSPKQFSYSLSQSRIFISSALASTDQQISIEQVTEENIMDLASLRNNCTSPEMVIEKQIAKRDSVDKQASLTKISAIGFGAGFVGATAALVNGESIATAIQNFCLLGALVGGALAFNFLFNGNGVYVYTLEEAENRLTVDFVEMIKKKRDIGFVARVQTQDLTEYKDGKFLGTNGVVGSLDCQQCKTSSGISYINMKNMYVDEALRRKGIAKKLLSSVESYAKSNNDITTLTLEVEKSNIAAVKLYESAGFNAVDSSSSRNEYGASKVIGRDLMIKKL